MHIIDVKYKTCWYEILNIDLDWYFVLDESEETNSEIQIKEKEEHKEIREHKTPGLPKKDIFRPYCLPDPDIKPINSSYNVRMYIYNFFCYQLL